MRKGQGLLETTIAIAILATGVIAAITLSISNTTSARQTTNRFIAANLAREGAEVVRNVRDTNWLAGVAYDTGLPSTPDISFVPVFNQVTNIWALSYSPNCFTDPPVCPAGAEVYSSNGQYVQTGDATQVGTKTPFKRIISVGWICRTGGGAETTQFTACSVGDTVIGRYVISAVVWTDASGQSTFAIPYKIYNWK